LARVPTGMKRGVSTMPWGVWKTPALAWVWLQRAWHWKENTESECMGGDRVGEPFTTIPKNFSKKPDGQREETRHF
jgi:hypothetical protein